MMCSLHCASCSFAYRLVVEYSSAPRDRYSGRRRCTMAGPLTIQQTLELARRTRHILDETRSLIASARRLLNPGWGISGGSEEDSDHAEALFRSIRSLLERGVLIPAPDNVWAGHGTGKLCFICRRLTPTKLRTRQASMPKSRSGFTSCASTSGGGRHESSRQSISLLRPN